MSTSAVRADPRVLSVRVDEDRLSVELVDGRTIAVPLSWFPRLASATPAERARWEIIAAGHGVRWPDLDEDLGVDGLLRGAHAPAR